MAKKRRAVDKWVRRHPDDKKGAGPRNVGPFPTKIGDTARKLIHQDEWTKCDGVWVSHLEESHIAHLFELSETEPKA